MEKLQQNAPYVYLTRPNGRGNYYLYILVAAGAGKKVIWNNNPPSKSKNLLFKYDLVNDNSSSISYYRKRVLISKPEIAKVEVQIKNGGSISKNITLFTNADDYAPPTTAATAFNCPYLYLKATLSTATNFNYHPFLFIWKKDVNFNPLSQNLNKSGGSCILTLNLQSNPGSGTGIINPDLFLCNGTTYTGGGENGAFEVSVDNGDDDTRIGKKDNDDGDES